MNAHEEEKEADEIDESTGCGPPTDSEDERIIDKVLRDMGDEDEVPGLIEDIVDVNDEEEPKRTLRDPGEPTKEEWEEHRCNQRRTRNRRDALHQPCARSR